MTNFYTDVIQKSPLFHSTARISDLGLLEPATRAAVQAIIADARVLGHDMTVFETFRSQARQEQLFENGATELRHVGVHGYGLAADIVKAGLEPWQGDFTFLLPLARRHGLISGQDWGKPGVRHSFVDADHVQRCGLADQDRLFAGSWYPDTGYNPYGVSA